jgi:hypothetical protein
LHSAGSSSVQLKPEPPRIAGVERIVVREHVRLARRIDEWIDREELVSCRVVVPVDGALECERGREARRDRAPSGMMVARRTYGGLIALVPHFALRRTTRTPRTGSSLLVRVVAKFARRTASLRTFRSEGVGQNRSWASLGSA